MVTFSMCIVEIIVRKYFHRGEPKCKKDREYRREEKSCIKIQNSSMKITVHRTMYHSYKKTQTKYITFAVPMNINGHKFYL